MSLCTKVFVNCIYLDKNIPKFITTEFLKEGKRNLSVVCDVSFKLPQPLVVRAMLISSVGDTTNPNNPIPFCNQPTYFNKPTITLPSFAAPPLSYITIDHLPSLLPREASEAFSEALLPSLFQLTERETAPVWMTAERLFQTKVRSLPSSLLGEAREEANGDAH